MAGPVRRTAPFALKRGGAGYAITWVESTHNWFESAMKVLEPALHMRAEVAQVGVPPNLVPSTNLVALGRMRVDVCQLRSGHGERSPARAPEAFRVGWSEPRYRPCVDSRSHGIYLRVSTPRSPSPKRRRCEVDPMDSLKAGFMWRGLWVFGVGCGACHVVSCGVGCGSRARAAHLDPTCRLSTSAPRARRSRPASKAGSARWF